MKNYHPLVICCKFFIYLEKLWKIRFWKNNFSGQTGGDNFFKFWILTRFQKIMVLKLRPPLKFLKNDIKPDHHHLLSKIFCNFIKIKRLNESANFAAQIKVSWIVDCISEYKSLVIKFVLCFLYTISIIKLASARSDNWHVRLIWEFSKNDNNNLQICTYTFISFVISFNNGFIYVFDSFKRSCNLVYRFNCKRYFYYVCSFKWSLYCSYCSFSEIITPRNLYFICFGSELAPYTIQIKSSDQNFSDWNNII